MIKSLLDLNFDFFKPSQQAQYIPKLQSHRGYRVGGAIENTLEALQESKRMKYQMVEFDLQLSKDKIPVLHHDSDLLRIYQDPRKVSEVTFSELEEMGVTSLESVLKDQNVPDYLNLEFKNTSAVKFEAETAAIKLIKKYRAEERIIFSTFNPFSSLYLSQNQNKNLVAFLICEIAEVGNPIWGQMALLLPFAQANILHIGHHQLTEERMLDFQKKNWLVNVWTINDVQQAQQFIGWGAHSIITDTILPHQI